MFDDDEPDERDPYQQAEDEACHRYHERRDDALTEQEDAR